MAHAMQSTLFRDRLERTLDRLLSGCERVQVASLPESVRSCMQQNELKLKICCYDLDAEKQSHLLSMLNDDWSRPFASTGRLTHYCGPNCCRDDSETKSKLRVVLQNCMGCLFPVPLLYRWKHFEGALAYTLRNCSIHGLLPYIWAACMNDSKDAALHEEVLEVDAADQAPAFQQQVRCSKVLRLLQQPDILAARTHLALMQPSGRRQVM